MQKTEVEWITAEGAADILGLSMSGFYSVAREQRRAAARGENVLRWRKVGRKYFFDKAFVELYKARR